jgi:hypothetical protein
MARLQWCREHIDEVQEACSLAPSTVAEVKQAAKFCDENSDFSEMPTKPIIALIRIKDDNVRERAIIKCRERLNGKIGAGRGNTKHITEKEVKKVITDIENEIRSELSKQYQEDILKIKESITDLQQQSPTTFVQQVIEQTPNITIKERIIEPPQPKPIISNAISVEEKIQFLTKNILKPSHLEYIQQMISSGNAENEVDALQIILDSVCEA